MGMGGLPGPMGPGNLPPPHLSPEALMALKKTRMDARDFPPFMNGGVPGEWRHRYAFMADTGTQPMPHSPLAIHSYSRLSNPSRW